MRALQNPSVLQVRCANCRLQLDVNKHILKPSDRWPAEKVHLVSRVEAFIGTVGCPECGHFTTFAHSQAT